jgi:hypothetical protein
MTRVLSVLLIGVGLVAGPSSAAIISFTDAPLVNVDTDNGMGKFANTPDMTPFSGSLDFTQDATGMIASLTGSISGGGNSQDFACCSSGIAGGIEVSNGDTPLIQEDVDFINMIAGQTIVSLGDIIDSIDIEGDATTAGGGRIEVGVSYILAGDAFDDESPSNYPFDESKIKLAVWFILEEAPGGADIYDAIGRIQVVPLPASVWLFGSAIGLLGFARRRAKTAIGA